MVSDIFSDTLACYSEFVLPKYMANFEQHVFYGRKSGKQCTWASPMQSFLPV